MKTATFILGVLLILGCVAASGCKDKSSEKSNQGSQPAATKSSPPPKTIHEAAERGDAEAVGRFLAKGVPISEKNSDGFTALHLAAAMGRVSVARLLLSKGANVNAGDKDGFTPLAFAAQNGHEQVARLLIDNGSSLESREGLMTPLETAKRSKHKAVADMLRRRGAKHHPSDTLFDAIENWDTKAVERFIAEGTPVNEPDAYDDPDLPLHHVAQKGFLDIAQLLVSKGASVNARCGQQQWTPLHDAVFRNHVEVAEFLLQKGAKVNARSTYGVTPMHWAKNNNNSAMIQLLAKYGGKASNAK